MTKHKRTDEVLVAGNSVAREESQVTQEGTDPVAPVAVTVGQPVTGWEVEVTSPEAQIGSPVPVERPEPVADSEEGEETIWSLMVKAGYMVW